MNRILLGLLLFFIFIEGYSQDKTDFRYYNPESEAPFFYYDVIYYPRETRDSVDIEIIIKVPFGAIQFIKEGDTFVGKYEINILLLDEEDVQVASKIWTQEIRTHNYDETNSLDYFDVSTLTLREEPSDYLLTIGIMDLETKKSSFRKKTLKLKNFYDKRLTISKLFIVDKIVRKDSTTVEFVPSVENVVSDDKPFFYIGFVILSDGGQGEIQYEIRDMANRLVQERTYKKEFKKGSAQELIKLSRKDLGFNRYKLNLKVSIGNEEVTRSLVFKVRWYGMTKFIDNLDEAIEQLRYIASPKVLREMKKGTEKEKKEKFLKFWAAMDPSPGTERNELMEEYYKRVKYANEHFSGFLPGWKTDMGMIFILFGPPNDVEKHPFEINTKPYEIWYYYDINRTFVFVDETGFGDYRLISPLYDIPGVY